MCGIYLTNIKEDLNVVNQNLKKIKFRGPDNISVKKYNDIIVGHLRLSILDLAERSNQPFEFLNYIISYNGEIYNFKEIKITLKSLGCIFKTNSDTEVLIQAYHIWGKKMLNKLNGMFAFIIYDIKENIVFCARDRIGQKPFFYYWDEGVLEICSSTQSMIKANTISELGIKIYLEAGYIPSPFSAYDKIHKLEPGHFITFNLNTFKVYKSKYWDLKAVSIKKISYRDAISQLHELIIDSVKIRLVSDVKFGSFLSGGIDSSLISAIANKISLTTLNTFTVGFNKHEYDERETSRAFSKILNTDHKEYLCDEKELLIALDDFFIAFDEPISDPAAIPTLMLSQKVCSEVKMCLSGDGGDESFLGYNHFEWVRKVKYFFWLPRRLRFLLKPGLFLLRPKLREYATKIFKFKSIKVFILNIYTGFSSITIEPTIDWLNNYKHYFKKSSNIIQQTADLNIKIWLEGNNSVKLDRASMYSSLELRSPFLDFRIIEFARSLPISYRFTQKKKKKILRDILKEYIDESVFDLPKKGFSVPISDWIRGPLKDEINELFVDSKLLLIPNLNIRKVKKLLKMHMNNEADFSNNIWKIYILIKWLDKNN